MREGCRGARIKQVIKSAEECVNIHAVTPTVYFEEKVFRAGGGGVVCKNTIITDISNVKTNMLRL